MQRIRIMTYNIHSCRGGDRRLLPERISDLIAASGADVVALQELDVGRSRSRRLDQVRFLADRLRMNAHFVAARPCDDGHYGNAVLTRLESRSLRTAALPQPIAHAEARAAQWVRVEAPFGPVDLVNTHFGLNRGERQLSADLLLGADWFGSAELAPHAVLCGDLNATPGSAVYRRLCARLADAQLARGRALPTFPALLPFVRIDHVLVSEALDVASVAVPASRLARVASDHRPVIVELGPRGADA